jgi:O-antigen/teichoic acid export membrane protein
VLGGAATFIINAQLVKRLGYKSPLKIDTKIAKSILKGSLPLGLMFVFSQINFKADAVLISLLKLPASIGLNNIESVAIYSLPYKIFEVALVLPTFFMNATYPIFVKKFQEGQRELAVLFKKTLGYLLALGLIVSTTAYVASPLVVRLLGGQEFDRSVEILKILSVGLFIFFLTQPVSYLIVTLDKQRYLPIIYLVSAIFNVSANLIFIPKYSFYASAYITWISEGLILIVLTFFAVKSWREHYEPE